MKFRCLPSALSLLFPVAFGASALAVDDIPNDLVVDVRVLEARSITPDFQAMESLAFFINTDGKGVTEEQWLATIARQAADSFLATLAYESIPLDASPLELELHKRSRTLKLEADFSDFVPEGVFLADVRGELTRGGEVQRSFEQTVEMQLGQTHVWSGRDWEFSASEYLSHFRDYEDSDDRGELYAELRDFTTFIIVAMTPRLASPRAPTEIVTLELPDNAQLLDLRSPLGTELVGTIELDLVLDASGYATDVKIVRSSIPELNSQVLSQAETWRFPDAAGKRGRLTLELKASP